MCGADALGVVDREAAELVDPRARLEVADGLADHLDPLVGREQRGILVRIVGHRDDHFVEDRDAAADDVDVPVVNRVKRPRVDRAPGCRILAFVHHATLPLELARRRRAVKSDPMIAQGCTIDRLESRRRNLRRAAGLAHDHVSVRAKQSAAGERSAAPRRSSRRDTARRRTPGRSARRARRAPRSHAPHRRR